MDVRAALLKKAALDEAKAILSGDEDTDGLSIRHRKALEMRGLERRTYTEIARRLECSDSQARRIVVEALDRLGKATAETAEDVRTFELMKLDRMEAVYTPKMEKGNVAAGLFILKVQLRRDRLMKLSGDEGEQRDPDEVEVPDWQPMTKATDEDVEAADLNDEIAAAVRDG